MDKNRQIHLRALGPKKGQNGAGVLCKPVVHRHEDAN